MNSSIVMTTYKLQQKDNYVFTDQILSEEEWLHVIYAADNEQHRQQLEVLKMFLCQPEHKGTCTQIGKEYSMSSSTINLLVQHFGRFVQKNCGKDFRIEDPEKDGNTFWPITMMGKNLKGNYYEWKLRPELVMAIRRFLVDKLLEAYRGLVISEGLNNTRSNELYKWQFISSVQGKNIIEVVHSMMTKECNFVEKPHSGATILFLLDSNPDKVVQTFEILLQDKPLDDRLREFSVAAKAITPPGKTSFGDERTAAAFLACVDPQYFTPYASTVYETYCKYLGIAIKSSGQKYSHFLELLKEIIPIEQQDAELQEALHQETDSIFWSDLLNAQDVLWQMKSYMESAHPKNWLQQIYDEAINTKNWVFEEWYPKYKTSVERFKDMFAEGKNAVDIDETTKEYFIKTHENHISSNLQGMYSSAEYDQILSFWPQMYDIFKRNIESGSISREDYDEMDLLIQPSLKRKHPAAFHRMWAGLFPDLLSTTISDSKFQGVYEKVRLIDPDIPKATGRWLEDNLTLMTYFKDKVTFKEPLHHGLFAWYLYENLSVNENNTDMEKYIDLLTTNHNIVLTGAPGTGKTYMAKQIAQLMIFGQIKDDMNDDEKKQFNEQCGFVQFHPSYDYTDLVEGLRPVHNDNDNVGFERKDGVFKEFCKKAILSQKTSSIDNFDTAWNLLVDYLNVNDFIDVPFISNSKKSFRVELNEYGTGLANRTYEDDAYQKGEWIKGQSKFFNKEQLYNIYRGFPGIPSGGHDNYRRAIVEKMKTEFGLKEYQKGETSSTDCEPFVFIIDEINRGELSKIFGELFFAIDPGYRGEKGRVKTQYQNLVEPGDPFEKGFFVPDNVYIIGTMNDIDRGVESMDFAVRRRFAWLEVKVEDRVSMLDEKVPDWSDAAKRCMNSINAALKEKTIGLTCAYDIGPAYFLKLELYDGDFEKLWDYHIKGVVTEYLRGTRDVKEKVAALKEAFNAYKD